MSQFLSLDALKPLPTPNEDESSFPSLTPPPPPSPDARHSLVPPPIPPKTADEVVSDVGAGNPQVVVPHSFAPDPVASSAPSSPAKFDTPSAGGKSTKINPLVDLVDTEKAYVDQLTGIIRKVAGAWSRSNLPPPELDSLFRSIEGVYKANRSLLLKLREIGSNPSSPKQLGDLLMRWIADLEGPYTNYCSNYCTGFDVWEPIRSNERLQAILVKFSSSEPPPPSLISDLVDPSIWTLDALFLLPKLRLKYYKKLYGRLQKSTTPGRPDHLLLVGALEKLDKLLSSLEGKAAIRAGAQSPPLPPPPFETEDKVAVDMSAPSVAIQDDPSLDGLVDSMPGKDNSSLRGSSSSGERSSRETAPTSVNRVSTMTVTMPVVDLERRLATERTLDIFTMTPKVVRLQIAPPTLTYTRELRFSVDVVIRLIPRSTGVEVVHRRGHVFLLSDLFLVCERMSSEERAQRGGDGSDMWLCYPPLAGKVLRVSEVDGQENALHVSIMRKENLILEAESVDVRDFMISEFKECIEFANVALAPNQPPPPTHPRQELPRTLQPFTPPDLNIPSRSGLIHPPMPDSGNIIYPNQGQPPLVSGPPSMNYPGGDGMYVAQQQVNRPSFNQDRDGFMTNNIANPSLTPEPEFPPPVNLGHGQLVSGPPSWAAPGMGPPPSFNQYPAPNLHLQPYQQGPRVPSYARSSRHAPMDPTYPGVEKSPSTRSLSSQYMQPRGGSVSPQPSNYSGRLSDFHSASSNDPSNLSVAHQSRLLLPSAQPSAPLEANKPSPPNSPVEEQFPTGPTTSTIAAQMKCKVFLQQQHAQWKSLGAAKLKLYLQQPTNVKQLVVETDNRRSAVLISTIVLTDGVERVGKTGVAVELSDKGMRTGIVYMIQLRNETSAGGLFDSLLAGSDRAGRA